MSQLVLCASDITPKAPATNGKYKINGIASTVMPPELFQAHQQDPCNNSNQSLQHRNNLTQSNYKNNSVSDSNGSTASLKSTTATEQFVQNSNHSDDIYTLPNIDATTATTTTPAQAPAPIIHIPYDNTTLRGKKVGEIQFVANRKPPSAPSVDIIGSVLGDFGIWQLRSVLILFLCKIPASWFMACIIYTAPEIKAPTQYRCDSSELGRNETISKDQCYVMDWGESVAVNGSGEMLSQEPCTDFIYEDDFYSLIMQFNLVCLREIFVAWTQYWHLFGVLLGGVIGTKAMLILSPRTVYVIGAVLQIGMGVITGYAPDLILHCIFRCLSAVCCALMFTCSQAIFTDITGGRYRTGVIVLYDAFWSLGVIILPGIASFFTSWNQLYLGITFPTIILLILLQWTPESPRWLLKNGNEQDVYRVEHMLRKAVDINERTFLVPDDFRQQLEKLRETLRSQKPPATWLQLWRGPRAAHYMLAAHIACACYIVNYMGMLLNLRSFGRDYRVPNTIVMGLVEIVGYFIALRLVMQWSQRKFMYAGLFNIFAGFIGCLGWTFTDISMNPDLKVVLWMLIAIIPKISVSCAQSMMQGCMAELMPANKRQTFVFSVVTWSRIWLLTAPFINVLKSVNTALSLTTFSVLTVVAGICTCLLQPPQDKKQRNKVNLNISRNSANEESNNKERSPLNTTVWTVEGDVTITRL